MNTPAELKYSESHEWVRMDGDLAIIGITDFAQHELGDVVYVELPEVGRSLTADEPFGTIESVKAVSDLISPVSGDIVEVNAGLADTPEIVNTDPYEAWLVKVRLDDASSLETLMNADEYDQFTQD